MLVNYYFAIVLYTGLNVGGLTQVDFETQQACATFAQQISQTNGFYAMCFRRVNGKRTVIK